MIDNTSNSTLLKLLGGKAMENNNKIVLSLALAAIIAVAAIGIGYAYTAMTTNSGNNAGIEYVSLIQGDDGKYQFSADDKIIWDTKDYRTGDETYTYHTEYRLNTPSVLTFDQDYVVVKIGDQFTIDAYPQTGGTYVSAGLETIFWTEGFNTVTMESDDGNPGDLTNNTVIGTLIFFIKVMNNTVEYDFKVENNNISVWKNSAWSSAAADVKYIIASVDSDDDSEKDAYAQSTITVYCGYTANQGKIEVRNEDNDKRPITSAPLTNASLHFMATIPGSNDPTPITNPVTAVAIYNEAGTEAIGDTATITTNTTYTAILTPSNATISAVYWSSSNPNVATVAGGEITIKTAGSTDIIVTTADGGFVDKVTVTVEI